MILGSTLTVSATTGDLTDVTGFADGDQRSVLGRVSVTATDGGTSLTFRAGVEDGWRVGDRIQMTYVAEGTK